MRTTLFLAAWVTIAPIAAAVTIEAAGYGHAIVRRQDGPVDPSTASDCTLFETVHDSSQKCEHWESVWSISHTDFVEWNPSVKSDCSGLKVGNSYCVEVNYGIPRPVKTSSSTQTAKPTANSKPSPTQPGLVQDCTAFYQARSGDTCDKIVASYATFTINDFFQWNPAVGEACSSLLANYYYCVGTPGSSSKPIPTNGPSPTQNGIAKDCTTFYKVQSGDSCQGIIDKYGTFSLEDFNKWNPAVGSDCRSLFAEYYVCVGVPGTPTEKPKPSGPSPTQAGIIKTCDKYYRAVSGDTCQGIVDKQGGNLKLGDFYKWNPAVRNDCSGLWMGYYYCVNVPAAFQVKAMYHADCTGKEHKRATIPDKSDGLCLDTNCAVASLDIAAVGQCPGGQVQLSYWERPGCSGKWYGYGYASRGQCRKLWTEGWKFRAVHLRCANEKDDCVNKGTCKFDAEPANFVC